MTARDVETLDFLDALAGDPSVSKTMSRQAIMPVYYRPRPIPTDPTERAQLAAELAAERTTGESS